MSFMSGGSLVLKTPVDLRGSSYFHGMPGMSSSAWPSAYGAIYRQHLWVYAVVNKRANAVGRLPLPVYRRDEDSRPRVDDHPMARLLRSPNPGLSGFDLWVWTQATRDIYGDAFWLKQRQRGQVVALYPLHPSSMRWEDGAWQFDNGAVQLRDIAAEDIVHFRAYAPDTMTWGLSPLEPLRSTLENEWHARTATSSFWQRGARPGTALEHPGTLSQTAADRLRANFDAIAAGSGNTGSTVVLEEGMKANPLTLTAEEAQYVETRKLNREEVCAAYDVPPPVVHILDHATFSNITEQMRSMYRDTMAPVLKGLESAVEKDLRAAEWPEDDIYAEFLMDEVLRGDFEARSDAYAKATHMTIAEKRRAENLPFIEGTDRIFLNTATLPLDAIDAQAAALARQPVTPAMRSTPVLSVKARGSDEQIANAREVMARFFEHQGAVVKASKSWDEDRWNDALADELFAVNVLLSTATGRKTLESLGFSADTYDKDRTVAWLKANAQGVAEGINGRTGAEVGAALDDKDPDVALTALFAGYVALRAAQIAETHTTSVSGFATSEAAQQTGMRGTKTWVTNSKNPRSSHAALNGQTVPINGLFSNGAKWPGDYVLVADERAGCKCSLTILLEADARGITQDTSRTVMGRLSWQKSLDEVDGAALTDGLTSPESVLQALDAAADVADLRERIRALVKE